MDYYCSIVNNQVIKNKEGPIALDAKVGWILSGPVKNPSVTIMDTIF